MNQIKDLDKHGYGTMNRTYVVAEIGLNHGGDIQKAFELIESASRTGADAVKFQTYDTEKRAPQGASGLKEILKKCEFSMAEFNELKIHAENQKIDFFSTVFDLSSLELLESIDCKMYKLASFDVTNKDLLKAVAETGKPVMLSVGMSKVDEIKIAYEILHKSTKNIALLHCISAYPTQAEDANLAVINNLYELFDCVIGQSDHTTGIEIPLYAVAAGAQIIEKHFRIDEKMDCIDAAVSISENQMSELVKKIRRIEKIFGSGYMGIRKVEEGTTIFRRYS